MKVEESKAFIYRDNEILKANQETYKNIVGAELITVESKQVFRVSGVGILKIYSRVLLTKRTNCTLIFHLKLIKVITETGRG